MTVTHVVVPRMSWMTVCHHTRAHVRRSFESPWSRFPTCREANLPACSKSATEWTPSRRRDADSVPAWMGDPVPGCRAPILAHPGCIVRCNNLKLCHRPVSRRFDFRRSSSGHTLARFPSAPTTNRRRANFGLRAPTFPQACRSQALPRTALTLLRSVGRCLDDALGPTDACMAISQAPLVTRQRTISGTGPMGPGMAVAGTTPPDRALFRPHGPHHAARATGLDTRRS